MEAYLYLTLTVLTTVFVFVALREIPRYKMNLHHVVSTNYFVAAGIGLVFNPQAFNEVLLEPGAVKLGVLIGGLFLGMFVLMGITAQRVGVMYMTIVTKMSVAIPVLFAWLYFSESMPWVRIAGLILALVAIFLVNYRPDNPIKLSESGSPLITLLLIVCLFVGSGAVDSLFKVFNVHYQQTVPNASFAVLLFAIAALIGIVMIVIRMMTRKEPIKARSLLGGIILGIPNYFSIVFLTQSLNYFDATVFYPVNNILILLLMALIGLMIYKESFNKWNLIGLAIAIIAVALLV